MTQNSIKSDKDIIVTYNAANALVDATVYKTGNRCFYYYAKVKHTSGLKTIQEPAPGEWKASYLFDASDDCKNQLAREDILKRDREGCDDLPTAIKTIKGAVGIEEPQKVVTIVNSVCLDALKELSYEEIIRLIKVIAKQPKLKEDSELAIIRLINAINSNKYGDFFRVLEENQNELIKYLVDQIDDASLCFWYDNNYTNFMGALVKMCQSQTTSYLNKIPEAGDEKLLGQVLNVYNQPFKNDLPATGIITGVVSMNEFTFCGIYDKDRGTIDIERKKLVINPAVTGSDVDNRPQPEVKGTIVATGLSPLTPIIYTAENELPLVATALDMPADTKAYQYIVPAIFLKYKGTKEFNDAAERSGMIVLDAVTIAASGSAALATKVNWVKRIWALMEVAGAIGDIAVTTETIETIEKDSKLRPAVDIFNATMSGIGIKNVGINSSRSISKFTENISDEAKEIIKNNKSLRDKVVAGEINWRTCIANLEELNDIEKKAKAEQEKVWKTIFNISSDAYIANPTYIKIMDALRKKHPDKLSLVENIGEVLKQIEINNLELLSKVEGFDKVLDDMTIFQKKFDGGEFQLLFSEGLAYRNKKNIKFEISPNSNIENRVYDITYDEFLKGRERPIKLELKNWNGFFHKAMSEQFVKDLQNMEVLGEIKWVFNKKGANSKLEYLKTNVMKALRKADGTPIEELEILFKVDDVGVIEHFSDIFGRNIENADDLIKAIEDPIIFNQLFKLSQ